ncbi:hypothetical protein HFO56_03190 [Rhizobium laguerreae]|uniref:hypothetical protein n=1 Tax=Rhizobium laguerreae TaxID=1076926 RepID=UPI001C909E4C|nr:hypothetical protein [Rhizobium laguerreae]MBY3151392.1 hypothetical protein [Rhizobium laguerreae]
MMRVYRLFLWILLSTVTFTATRADAHGLGWSYRSCIIQYDACLQAITQIAEKLRPLYKTLDLVGDSVEMEDFQPTVHALLECDFGGVIIFVTSSPEWPEFRRTIANDIRERLADAGADCDSETVRR